MEVGTVLGYVLGPQDVSLVLNALPLRVSLRSPIVFIFPSLRV